ncbi:putative UPF0481 protein At3g02645 [Vicia villosa]|uniref:putative UPF0481 protein At3g02645 n=1 Tax=Vicia villosa TaxID=3911 RepID=UPI00273C9818|nr:putative UPF0481 protein At3g02645 [Vicia villosa]
MDELNLKNMSPDDVLEHRLEKMRISTEIPRSLHPKIQKVANDIRERKDYQSHYFPKLISMGPIHHGNAELQIGEQYKLIWAQKYIESTGHSSKDLYKTIADHLVELKSHYADNVLTMASNTNLKSFGSFEEKLTWMLFVDGCCLLYILDRDRFIETDDTIQKLVSRDVFLLENQLAPFMLMRLLSDDRFNLIERVHLFLDSNDISIVEINQADNLRDIETTTHLLDLLRKKLLFQPPTNKDILIKEECVFLGEQLTIFCQKGQRRIDHSKVDSFIWRGVTLMKPLDVVDGKMDVEIREHAQRIRVAYLLKAGGQSSNSNNVLRRHLAHTSEKRINTVVRYMNIQELKSNGIRIKSKKSSLLDMSFSHRLLNGELKLPEIVINDITVSIFLNLIAYEMCPDFENDYMIGSFLTFLNSLIRQPEDVKDLRLAGILFSNCGNDEELVKLFHFLATDIVSKEEAYKYVFEEIEEHIANKWKVNTVRFLKYIRHPWTNFAIHATELALALTFIQTWFTIHPAKTN